jgi:hypothetical protein
LIEDFHDDQGCQIRTACLRDQGQACGSKRKILRNCSLAACDCVEL